MAFHRIKGIGSKSRLQRNRRSRARTFELLDDRIALTASVPDIVTFDAVTRQQSVISSQSLARELSGALEGGVAGFEASLDEMTGPQGHSPASFDETVFGNDDRVLITDPTAAPYRRSGSMRMQVTDGTWSFCSGSMVGPFHFLTAGHCVHEGGGGAVNWFSNVEVTLGRDGDERWYGAARATLLVSNTAWTNNDDPLHDWALITLDRNIGNITGWNGWWWYSNNSSLTNLPVSIAGYPSDLATSWNQTQLSTDTHQIEMYESTGNTLTPTAEQLRYNGTLDTFGGMSGSSVIEDKAGVGRVAVGVHAYGDWGDGTNRATRMREYISNIINDHRNNDPVPTDYADLVDWDQWFDSDFAYMNSSFVVPGGNFSVVSYPRNNGTASTGSYSVSFYASTNDFISTSDYLLGTVNMGSLAPYNWDTASLNVAFPSNVPAGNYYVGWIIDSGNTVPEFNNSNNTGVITNSQLTVGADDHGNSPGTATRILADSNTFGNLEAAGDVDWFTLEASAGSQITLQTQLGSLPDSVLRLYAADGVTLLASNDDYPGLGLASQIDYTVPTQGTYYVTVRDYQDNDPGTYSLTLNHVDDHPDSGLSGTLIGSDSVTAGDLEVGGDLDRFYFYADSGSQVTLQTALGTLPDSILRLYDSDGVTELAMNDDYPGLGLASQIDYTFANSGYYFVQVEDYGIPHSGSYSLSLQHADDHGDSSGAATVMAVGGSSAGGIEVNFDRDFFQFNATAGTNYTLQTVLGSLADSTLTLYDTDGTTELAYNDDFGGTLASAIVWTAPNSGIYFVAVAGFSVSTGTYDLLIDDNSSIVDGDFNDDGLYDLLDIDALVAEIAAGTHQPAFDLTGDSLVNLSDRDAWLAEAGGVNLGPGRVYPLGDANLDSFVDGSDFNLWNSNKFTSVAAWSKGDFNADGVVDGSDFNIWNSLKFTGALRPMIGQEPLESVSRDWSATLKSIDDKSSNGFA